MQSVIFFCLLAASTLGFTADSPYRGQQTRDIKSLSPGEQQSLLTGAGMGMAKAAELNRYPGPKHVIELAASLGLCDEQLIKTRQLFEQMHTRAMALGRQLVETERKLDQAFGDATISAHSMRELVAHSATIRGELRLVHLGAHLEQRELLSEAQIAHYLELRGYAADSGSHDQRQHH